MMMTEYKIAKGSAGCPCGRVFGEGEPFVAALFEAGDSFDRRDFCPSCWSEPPDTYSFWHTRTPRRDEKKRENPVAVWAFFEALSREADPQRRKLAFLLSLTLQRKRILKMTGSRREGPREYLLLEKKPECTIFEVEVPEIRDDEMAGLREELVRLLDSTV